MKALLDFSQRLTERNQAEYGIEYSQLTFLSSEEKIIAQQTRTQLLKELETLVEWSFNQTKADTRRISPGCRLCGEGKWSCLFISGKCNCKCFYCPTDQSEFGEPTTNTVNFPNPEEYLEYLERYSFKGVSISGGEPLLTFEKTLDYLTRIKRKFGKDIYFWMYTNGTLLDEEKVELLKAAGLDELRFDIGATDYRLDKLKLAVGKIPHVTVEIPAVPEEFERMKEKMRELKELGVDFLNLHQMRLTPYNFKHLVNRGYTFLHGERVTILESELTALRLMKYSVESGLNLPVNYCSFAFKNRYQRSAARKRSALEIMNSYEDLTELGYIRSLYVTGEKELLLDCVQQLKEKQYDESLWKLNYSKTRLSFSESLWNEMDFSGLTLGVEYYETLMLPAVSYRNPFKVINLTPQKQLVFERRAVARDLIIEVEEMEKFRSLISMANYSAEPGSPDLEEMARFERIPVGLQEYF